MDCKCSIALAVAMAMSGGDSDEQPQTTTTPVVAARTAPRSITVMSTNGAMADHVDCAPRGVFTTTAVGPPPAGTVILGGAGTGTYGATYGAYGGGYGATYGAAAGTDGGGTVKARRGLFGRAGGGGLFRGRLGRGGGGCGG